MTARFSPRVETALRGLAGLPWEEQDFQSGAVTYKLVRCDIRCPVQMLYERATGLYGTLPGAKAGIYNSAIGWELDDHWPVVEAADRHEDPLRPRLLALLRGEA